MNKSPAFQFYADDFLAGTISMTNEERGLYITLLCRQWTQGYVTKNEIARLSLGMAQPSVDHVLSKFKDDGSGNYRNDRLETERQKQSEFRANRSESGKAGAEKRWHSHSTAIAQPMAKHSSPSPSPSPIHKDHKASEKVFTQRMTNLTARFHKALGEHWENDRQKWMGRIKNFTNLADKVIAEVENAMKEGRIKTTPAQYAQQIWKEFK